jgi:uncharacterized membrane protein YeaQ/YmgE (transglycosylase-associated protein family)
MSVALFIFWGAVGWCGTPWPWRVPPPPPPPDLWWFIDRIVGIVGGIIGGWLFAQAWPIPQADAALAVLASGAGALVGTLILSDLYALVRRGRTAGAAGGSASKG